MNNTTYIVNTTNNAVIPLGFVQISADIRDTDKKTVSPEERYRNILIKELAILSVEDKLKPVLLAKFYELAADQFKETMSNTGRMARTVECSAYTVDGLLRHYVSDAKSGRMTKESVLEWFDSSATKQFIASKNANAVFVYRENYAKLASPNHGVSVQSCTALLSVVQDADTSHAVCVSIVNKMQTTIDKAGKSELVALL